MKKKLRFNYCDNSPNKQCHLGAACRFKWASTKKSKSSIHTGSARWNQTHFYAVSGFPRGVGAIDSVTHGLHQLFGVLRNGPNVPQEWTNHIGHCSPFNGWEPVIVGCRLFTFSAHNFFFVPQVLPHSFHFWPLSFPDSQTLLWHKCCFISDFLFVIFKFRCWRSFRCLFVATTRTSNYVGSNFMLCFYYFHRPVSLKLFI